jgi:hypothetical protein
VTRGLPTVAGVLLASAVAQAHGPAAADVVGALEASAVRARFGVMAAARDAKAPRVLLVRVGPKWSEAPADDRRTAAEEWLQLWRAAVPHGIVAVLDDETSASLVNFDATGHARLVGPPAR